MIGSQYIDDGITVQKCSGNMGDGYFATKFLKKDSLILKTPAQENITCYTPLKFGDFNHMLKLGVLDAEGKLNVLAYYLAYIELMMRKGKDIEGIRLETDFLESIKYKPETPLAYNDQELGSVKSGEFKERVEKEKQVISESYEFIIQQLQIYEQIKSEKRKLVRTDPKEVTFPDMLRLRSIIDSSLLDIGNYEEGVLNGKMRKFNHSSLGANCMGKYVNDGIQVYTSRDIKEGQQLFLYYGNHSDEDFFQYYGFQPHYQYIHQMYPQAENMSKIPSENSSFPANSQQYRVCITSLYNIKQKP